MESTSSSRASASQRSRWSRIASVVDPYFMAFDNDGITARGASDGYARTVRDLRRSLTLGPGAALLSIALYAILYPLIVSGFGYEVLGLWGLLTAVSLALLAADAGFSLQVQRDTTRNLSPSAHRGIRSDIAASRGLYLSLAAAAGLILTFVAPSLGDRVDGVYSSTGLVRIGRHPHRRGRRSTFRSTRPSSPSGLEDAPYTYVVDLTRPVVTFAFALAGIRIGAPLEGLGAVATLASSSTVALGYRYRIWRRHAGWLTVKPARHSTFNLPRAIGFAFRGRGFMQLPSAW